MPSIVHAVVSGRKSPASCIRKVDMFWALQKRREDIDKAWREGFEEGRRRGRQAVLEKLAGEMSGDDSEARAWFVRAMEAAQADMPQVPGTHRFDKVPGYESVAGVREPRSLGAAMPPTSSFPAFSTVDWTVSTPLGNKTVAFVPGGNGRFKAILVDADPIGMPQG